MHKSIFAAAVVAVAMAAPALGAIEYDSLGFETAAGFEPGVSLEGQAGGAPSLEFLATSNSVDSPDVQIGAGIGVGGTNGVAFNHVDQEGSYDSTQIGIDLPGGGEVPTAPVSVSTAINVQQFAGAPFFGFSSLGEPAGPFAATQPLISDVVINSTDGAVYVNDASDLGFMPTPVAIVPLSVYNHFETILDFDTKTYDLLINSTFVGTFTFRGDQSGANVDGLGRVNDFNSAMLIAFDSQASGGTAGTAFYDDLLITVIPEPGSLALAGVASLALLRRRRA